MQNSENLQAREVIERAARKEGLSWLGVSDTELSACEPRLQAWLNAGMHGDMDYMARHGVARLHADTVYPGAIRVLSFRIPYLPQKNKTQAMNALCTDVLQAIENAQSPYTSLYARGRDYHKVIRKKLQAFAQHVHDELGEFGFRVTCDSAPVAEVEIARKAGLGWRGKHTLLIHPKQGSFFFLGEVFTNLPVTLSEPFEANHCGQCDACITACPTGAILREGVVDARRCVSYLTIEHKESIPHDLRPLIGTRIYGCDDCQLVCPWNKFAQPSTWADFDERPAWVETDWAVLFDWNEAQFLKLTEGSAIRRLGYRRFRRNLMVAAGNARGAEARLYTLVASAVAAEPDAMVREHAYWALSQLESRLAP